MAYGYDPMFDEDVPEECVECAKPLDETNDTGFCCDAHRIAWDERQRAADLAYAEALVEEAKHAAEWRAEEARERREARGLPERDEFVIPERLMPSTFMGLMMTKAFMQTPEKERV